MLHFKSVNQGQYIKRLFILLITKVFFFKKRKKSYFTLSVAHQSILNESTKLYFYVVNGCILKYTAFHQIQYSPIIVILTISNSNVYFLVLFLHILNVFLHLF